jgi:hypothetical protein
VLDQVGELIQGVSSSSLPASPTPSTTEGEDAKVKKAQKENDTLALSSAKICATFAQTTAVLEQAEISDGTGFLQLLCPTGLTIT